MLKELLPNNADTKEMLKEAILKFQKSIAPSVSNTDRMEQIPLQDIVPDSDVETESKYQPTQVPTNPTILTTPERASVRAAIITATSRSGSRSGASCSSVSTLTHSTRNRAATRNNN